MANLVIPILTNGAKLAKANFVRKTRQVDVFQERFLRSLLQAYQGTELGQKYGLGDIKTIEQFQGRVPILPYSSYEPYVERIAAGESNILTPDPVIYINLTSGSTGKKKLIPVTNRSRQVLNWANRVCIGFVADAAHRHGSSLGKILVTSSVQLMGHSSSGIPYGPVSVGDLRLNKLLYKQLVAHPYQALLPADAKTRHYMCLLFALRNPDMRIIGANFPVLGLHLANYLESCAPELIHDLKTGEITSTLELEPEIRAQLQRQFSALPKRARELEEILRSEGRLTPHLAWPNLTCITTARGGTSNFYFERFPSYFGNTPIFGGVYASAEATFGIYEDFNNDGAILSIDTGFFEFIAPDQWDVEQPKTLLPQEVEVGQYYRILVTNYNGFYRYDIGDVVEVVGFYHQTPMLSFRHRVGGLLSSTTEKTNEFHATQVMQQLQQDFDLPLENFCITLSEQEIPAHYLLNIEVVSGHTLSNPQAFLAQFDQKLKHTNRSYQEKRLNHGVPSPRLRILAPGSFAQLRQRLLQKGIPASQLKFPHISENRQFLAGLTVQREVRLPADENLYSATHN